jgi:hypothetical protein
LLASVSKRNVVIRADSARILCKGVGMSSQSPELACVPFLYLPR